MAQVDPTKRIPKLSHGRIEAGDAGVTKVLETQATGSWDTSVWLWYVSLLFTQLSILNICRACPTPYDEESRCDNKYHTALQDAPSSNI
jgi:hypothetical protein